MSQITTHILAISSGLPASGVKVSLQKPIAKDQWENISETITNEDGRAPELLQEGQIIEPGIYRMYFETKIYFETKGIQTFYPYVVIVFEITDKKHYHVPLLISPFGYSTYRGS